MCPKQVCQVSASSTLWFLRRFLILFENLPFMWPRQPIKLSDLDKSHMKREGLLNKHICEKKIQISQISQQKLSISAFPIIFPTTQIDFILYRRSFRKQVSNLKDILGEENAPQHRLLVGDFSFRPSPTQAQVCATHQGVESKRPREASRALRSV